MITVDHIPRDDNGIVQGAWRLLHEDPTYRGDIGVFEMIDGESVEPACGRLLICAVNEFGPHLFLEPWGALPAGFEMPEMMVAEPDPAFVATLPRCPWRGALPPAPLPPVLDDPKTEEPAALADALDAMAIDDLRALAELHEMKLDGRWKEERIRAALREAGVTSA